MMKKLKQMLRKWWMFILFSLGLIAPVIHAEIIAFSWQNATQRVDGTPLLAEDIAETRIYCNGNLVGTVTGALTTANIDLSVGSYECYGTHVDTNGLESDPSNIVTKVVLPAPPLPPTMEQ